MQKHSSNNIKQLKKMRCAAKYRGGFLAKKTAIRKSKKSQGRSPGEVILFLEAFKSKTPVKKLKFCVWCGGPAFPMGLVFFARVNTPPPLYIMI
jgi:hypothetical protein